MKKAGLGELKTLENLVFSWYPRKDLSIKVRTYSLGEMATFLIPRVYRASLCMNRETINEAFKALYGRTYSFRDNKIGEFLIKVREIERASGYNIHRTAIMLKAFIGTRQPLLTPEGKPITSDRIIRAIEVMNLGGHPDEARKILFT